MVGDVRRSGAILAPARRGLSGFLRTYAGAADPPRPNGPLMRVYDRFTLGDLIEISVIDGRQYRSRQACYAPPNKGGAHLETNASCPERLDPGRTMLGFGQEAWLYAGLAHSKARWNL